MHSPKVRSRSSQNQKPIPPLHSRLSREWQGPKHLSTICCLSGTLVGSWITSGGMLQSQLLLHSMQSYQEAAQPIASQHPLPRNIILNKVIRKAPLVKGHLKATFSPSTANTLIYTTTCLGLIVTSYLSPCLTPFSGFPLIFC